MTDFSKLLFNLFGFELKKSHLVIEKKMMRTTLLALLAIVTLAAAHELDNCAYLLFVAPPFSVFPCADVHTLRFI